MTTDTLILILIGFTSGVLSGLGFGGGTVLIPMLTLILSYDQHVAQWLNVLVFLPASLVSLIVHCKSKMILLKPAIGLMAGAIPSAIVFGFFSVKASTLALSKAFGAFLILIGIIEMVKTFKKSKDPYALSSPNE